MTQQAVVEVLTAEVHVLMVGSRQVTLSVYGQLDWVECDEIEPFGRVCPKSADSDLIHVVGRSTRLTDVGALARSLVPHEGSLESLRRLGTMQDHGGLVYFEWRRRLSDPYRRELIEQAAHEWESLPLIVLAGLR